MNLSGFGLYVYNFYRFSDFFIGIFELIYIILLLILLMGLYKRYYAKGYLLLSWLGLFLPVSRYIVVLFCARTKIVRMKNISGKDGRNFSVVRARIHTALMAPMVLTAPMAARTVPTITPTALTAARTVLIIIPEILMAGRTDMARGRSPVRMRRMIRFRNSRPALRPVLLPAQARRPEKSGILPPLRIIDRGTAETTICSTESFN